VQVSLVEHDDVIQTFAADRPAQPFYVRRLPGRPGRNSDLLEAQSLGAVLELKTINAIAVSQEILRGRGEGEGFAELLGCPNRRRTLHDIEMEHPAAMMGKDEEDVEHLKVNGGNGQEIDRNHAGKVITQESFPVVGRGATAARDHIVGDGSLRDGDTELEQLAVNSGSPHNGLARFIFRIKAMVAGAMVFRPVLRGWLFHRQKSRNPALCHRMTVLG
jgi:hypothetical protein